MKRLFLALILFITWFAIAGTYYTFVIKGIDSSKIKTVETPLKIEKTKIVRVPTSEITELNIIDSIPKDKKTFKPDTLKVVNLTIKDADFVIKNYYGNFKIYQNSDRVQIPYGISEYGYVIAKHMDSINSKLIIESAYNQDENEEIGKNRALYLKKKLVQLGIPDSLINTKTKEAIYNYTYNKFIGGINFEFPKAENQISLKKIDFSQVTIKKAEENTSYTSVNTQAPTVIKKESRTTKKETTLPKKAKIDNNTTKKAKNISYTVMGKDFRNGKFRPNRRFKDFMAANKSAEKIELLGFSNANNTDTENYNKGIQFSKMLNEYFEKKNVFTGAVKVNALKREKNASDSLIREGVTLIVK